MKKCVIELSVIFVALLGKL